MGYDADEIALMKRNARAVSQAAEGAVSSVSPVPSMSVEIVDGGNLADVMSLAGKDALQAIRPEMKAAMEPMASAARAGVHSVSGALSDALRVRIGARDFPGRYSVYISATTTRAAIAKKQYAGKARQTMSRGQASDRYSVWYALPLERGHKASGWYGEQAGAKDVPAHPFAQPAFDATAASVAAQTGERIMDRLMVAW